MARISSTPMDSPSGMTLRTSAWVPAIVVMHALHRPQPGSPSEVHCSAAAKHTAATERPDPGGPVINHACVIARFGRIVSGITAGGPRGGGQLRFHCLLAHQTRKNPAHHRQQ